MKLTKRQENIKKAIKIAYYDALDVIEAVGIENAMDNIEAFYSSEIAAKGIHQVALVALLEAMICLELEKKEKEDP